MQRQSAQRPMGVTILAGYAFVVGALGLTGLFLFLAFLVLGATGISSARPGYSIVWIIIWTMTGVLSAAYLALSYGAWNLRRWAWTLGIGSSVVSILVSILIMLVNLDRDRGVPGEMSVQISVVVPPLIVIYYLMTPNVRKLFGRNTDL